MRRRRAALHSFVLPLERPIATAHGRIAERAGWLVELEDADAGRGFGEAAPLPAFGTEDLETSRHRLEAALSAWVGGNEEALPGADAPCARSAVESARFDLVARRASRSLAAELAERAGRVDGPARSVRVQALVSGDDPASVEESARTLVRAGFDTFKLKLAASPARHDLELDLERVGALRAAVGAEACLRLDANEAWDRGQAAAALAALAPFSVDYVEQPVPREDLESLAWLSEQGSTAVAADEALLGDGLAACLERRAASILVVKPAALGGPTPALMLWQRAQREGLRIVWSNLFEGAVGRAVGVALAAGLGPVDEVHGLGTAQLLAADLVAGPVLDEPDGRGRIPVSDAPGIGFDPVCPRVGVARDRAAEGDAVFEVEL